MARLWRDYSLSIAVGTLFIVSFVLLLIVLTTYLVHRGSPESKDGDEQVQAAAWTSVLTATRSSPSAAGPAIVSTTGGWDQRGCMPGRHEANAGYPGLTSRPATRGRRCGRIAARSA